MSAVRWIREHPNLTAFTLLAVFTVAMLAVGVWTMFQDPQVCS